MLEINVLSNDLGLHGYLEGTLMRRSCVGFVWSASFTPLPPVIVTSSLL